MTAIILGGKVVDELTNTEIEVIELCRSYRYHCWRERSNAYILWRLFQEFCELALAIAGLHHHPPKTELRQIAAICINWMEWRWLPQEGSAWLPSKNSA